MPNWVWPAHDAVRSRPRNRSAAGRDLPVGREQPPASLRWRGQVPEDPNWRDNLLFYEYFHGDNGAGLGAGHQTGWTGVIARVLHLFATTSAEEIADRGLAALDDDAI